MRKGYSKEFKLDAVSLVLDQGYTRAEAARHMPYVYCGCGNGLTTRLVIDITMLFI
jgi:hypothetical protein